MSSKEGEMSSLRCSPAAEVLDDDDLLSEILLRLPPQPSSLPRASLVCKRWRSLVSDPKFTRRFRLRHRRNPALLGCFVQRASGLTFLPTMEAPNRVPPERFSLQFYNRSELLGCRHGLVLLFSASRKQVLVWDPVTDDQHRIAVPTGFDKTVIHGMVLRTTGDVQPFHFQVVLAAADNKDKQHRRAIGRVYSSETGVWGDLISAPLQPMAPTSDLRVAVLLGKPAVLAENSLHWILGGDLVRILEFDFERKSIAVIQAPVDVFREGKHEYTVMRAEGGGLGFLLVSKLDGIAQLWKRMTDCSGVASWVLDRTIELGKLLSLNSQEERGHLWILGYAGDNNVVFLWTLKDIFMVHLDSLQFRKLPGCNQDFCYHPFESVYAAGI